MKTTSLFVAGLAIATLSSAPGNAAPRKHAVAGKQTASSDVYNPAIRAKVLDPDVRLYAPGAARTYRDCQDKLRAQGVGLNYQWYVCSSMGYKS